MLKVTENARTKYAQHCPVSTQKCQSIEELNYKIRRCVELGQVIKIKDNGTKVIQYHYNQFLVKRSSIIDVRKNRKAYVHVDEKLKDRHEQVFEKVTV